MYKISRYYAAVAIAFLMLSQISCLKDEGADAGQYGMAGFEGGEFVSIPAAASSPFSIAVESKPGNQPLQLFSVNYESVNKAPEDLVVKFVKDDAAVSAIAGLTLIPASVLTFSSAAPEVTIAKGTRVSPAFGLQINTSTLDPAKAYGLAFTIQSVSKSGVSIPANLKTVVYKIALKNKYDGVYTVVSGLVTRYASPGVPLGDALSGPLAGNPDVYLVTKGPNEVGFPIPGETGSLYWAAGTGSQVAGINDTRITIDGATNLTTSRSLGNATLANWDGKVNKYDPATKTFTLAFKWNPTANVREYEIVLKYKKAR